MIFLYLRSMKQGAWIGFVVAMLMAACSSFPSASGRLATTDPTLASIDSLLWTQPDSAFAQLQAFAESREMDSLDTFNWHYFHLLLSELLYKNDYAQTNRDELLKAVDYYDSLVDVCGKRVHPDLVFLDARAHYIDGVGYYEMDSAVPACEQYLKAVEVMEDQFSEEELVGKKAQFMALAYTHLCILFSDQYLHEQAIHYGKQSLPYYKRYEATPWHISWMLEKIGSHYHMINHTDSADYYYSNALDVVPDSNSMVYRDVLAARTLLSYYSGKNPQRDLETMRRLINQAETNQEYLARKLNTSELYINEKLYDSAWTFLTQVFNESDNIESKKQAAEWLVEICKVKGESYESYSEFLVPFANQEENNSAVKSKLTDMFDSFRMRTIEHQHRQKVKENAKWTMLVVGGLLSVILVFLFLHHRKKEQVKSLEYQIQEQASSKNKWDVMEQFLSEPICQDIIHSVKGKNIKRSSVSLKYPEYALNESQLNELAMTVSRYFGPVENLLDHSGMNLNPTLLNQCRLYLLGLDEKQIAVLLNKDYSSVTRYENKLKKAFKTQKAMVTFLRMLVLNS